MFPRLTPAVQALLIANAAVFLLQFFLADQALEYFKLWPVSALASSAGYGFQPWQLLSSGFMHDGVMHIAFNMLAIWMFGSALEERWGYRDFMTFFLICVVGSNLCQLLVSSGMAAWDGSIIRTVGASGGVYGVLLGFAMVFPNRRMVLFPFPAEIPARTLVMIYGALALFYGITGTQAGVAHFAHLGGMLFGWLVIRYWRRQPPFGGPRKKKGPQLRVVK
ncbi:rhomboid family intramembrane serine protease [Pseudoxanthomonas sp. LjRoot168]|uniref:rhomboid family intramembrane serine protease n=1 Tax=unclassified Pseudoxanthomonas TaxID=2645906 RepID=UPI003ECC3631